jgi:hypothetical protein
MDPVDLLERHADERLLGEVNLPHSVGRPAPLPPPSPARRRIVALGATLTGVTLVVGTVLLIAGLVGLIASGFGALQIVALVLGLVLAGTHWGWVHVAELTGQAIEGRQQAGALDRQRLWLDQIKPYPRYEVATTVDHDGSIRITRVRHDPQPTERGFTFVRTLELEEVHSADEPSAAVAERAELLRRQAAADTEREHQRFETAADAYETALLNADDEQQRQAARRAASEALSEQINANLRDPPLVE